MNNSINYSKYNDVFLKIQSQNFKIVHDNAVTPTFGFSIESNTLQMKGPSYVIIFYYNSHN